jgi:aspartate dehydrogenase
MLKVGILGAGAIGAIVANAIDRKQVEAQLVAVTDQDRDRAKNLSASLSSHPPVLSTEEMIDRADLCFEAASQEALECFVPKALERARDMLIMSVGGLLGREDWFRQAAERGCRIHVPSGALAGLDGIKSASVGRLDSVSLTSRKPVAALLGAKYVVDHNLQLETFTEETVIFEGSVEDAARAFPKTANVAAALRLAVSAGVPVHARIVAVPDGKTNIHEIRVIGEFGRFTAISENNPSKENPRTSQLAAYSAIATLSALTKAVQVGT